MKNSIVKQSKKQSNLKPWKPGESGNPAGRPKKERAMSDILRKIGELKDGEVSRLEKLCEIIWQMALSGDMAAINFIADRLEGKPRQALEIRPEREKCTLTVIN